MKSKRGFTLVELLGAIVILAILSLIAIPVVTNSVKRNKEKLYDIQIKNVESAAKAWGSDNLNLLPDEGEYITISLSELQKNGYVDKDIKNPKTGEALEDFNITICNIDNQYTYKKDGDCEVPIESDATLTSLKVNGEEVLTKEDYTIVLNSGITSIEITAKAKNEKAKINGTGTQTVNSGTNTFEVTVTSEDGKKQKKYSIKVIVDKSVAENPTTSYCKTGLVYTGNTQTLTKEAGIGYTFSKNTGTNAGSYKVEAVLSDGYKWSDDTTGTKTISCSIDKATPTVTLSSESGTVTYGTSSKTFTVETSIDGIISLSDDNDKATESYDTLSSNKYNVTVSNLENISAGITVKVTVKFTPDDEKNYKGVTKEYALTIGKKAITVTASSKEKKYDGTALSYANGCSVTSGSLSSGDTITCINSGSITNKGSTTNTLNTVTIKNGTTDVTDNYTITKKNGTLTVNARATTCISGSASRAYNGSVFTSRDTGNCTNLVSGQEAIFSGHTGSITNVGSTANTFGNVVIKNGTTDVTNNYTITKETGTLTITKATPIITLSSESGEVESGKIITFTEKANVAGSFSNVSGTTSVATVSQSSYSDITANTENKVTVKGESSGTSTITVTFTPTDTTNYNTATTTYTANVKKSSVATLKSLKLLHLPNYPYEDSKNYRQIDLVENDFNYDIEIEKNIDTSINDLIALSAETTDKNAKISVCFSTSITENGDCPDPGWYQYSNNLDNESVNITLENGNEPNVIMIKVTAHDGTEKIYRIYVRRKKSSVATLKWLYIADDNSNEICSLNPEFKSETTYYECMLNDENISTVHLMARTTDDNAIITDSETNETNYLNKEITITEDTTQIEVKIQPENTESKTVTYTIDIIRKKSSDTTLISLGMMAINEEGNGQEGQLELISSSDSPQYYSQVASDVNRVKITAVANDEKAKITLIDGENKSYTDDTYYIEKTLDIGEVGSTNSIQVLVTAHDGTEKIYRIDVYRESNDTSLNQVLVKDNNGNTLCTFDNENLNEYYNEDKKYNCEVASDVNSVKIIVTAHDEKTKLKYKGQELNEGLLELSDLNLGDNIEAINVYADDENINNTFTFNIYRKSGNTSLSSIVIKDSNNVDDILCTYEMLESNMCKVSKDSIFVDVQLDDNNASYYVTGGDSLKLGDNTITIKVTAEDSKNTNDYTINVYRQSTVATLSSLSVKDSSGNEVCTLDPIFSSETTSYRCIVDNNVESTTVTATATDGKATVKSGTGEKYLSVGINKIEVIVESEDTDYTKTYTINITRSSDATLSSLSLTHLANDDTESPVDLNFSSKKTYYLVTIDRNRSENNTKDNIEISAQANDSNASITIHYTDESSYTPEKDPNIISKASSILSNGNGTNTIIIEVKPEYGESNSYTIDINRYAPSSDATLSSLSVKDSSGNEVCTLEPTFSSETTSYSCIVDNNVESVTISAKTKNDYAKITASKKNELKEENYPLNLGDNYYQIEVEPENQEKETNLYSITIKRKYDTTLSSLSVKDSSENEVCSLDNIINEETCSVDLDKVTIEAEPTSTESKVSGDVGEITLYGGETTKTIIVTAPDGSTTSYSLKIYSPTNPINTISLSGGNEDNGVLYFEQDNKPELDISFKNKYSYIEIYSNCGEESNQSFYYSDNPDNFSTTVNVCPGVGDISYKIYWDDEYWGKVSRNYPINTSIFVYYDNTNLNFNRVSNSTATCSEPVTTNENSVTITNVECTLSTYGEYSTEVSYYPTLSHYNDLSEKYPEYNGFNKFTIDVDVGNTICSNEYEIISSDEHYTNKYKLCVTMNANG